ncbi:MAG: HAMP domain-containing sensor histidine kinase [Sulfurospirillaceae bacterium]|nr:HAMP domain-containing sensor histidine kinase [Sulfurospirillaceae bacterium]
MQLNEQLLITYECVSAIGTSLHLEEMITYFLKVFSRKTGALASIYWEYEPDKRVYNQTCFYGKRSFYTLFDAPSIHLPHNAIMTDSTATKSLLHVKIKNDWIVFLFQHDGVDLDLIQSIINSFHAKLENAILACKNHLELLEINQTLAKRIEEEVAKNREKDKHILQQSRLAQMGEMISMIAHQWRQPLGSISAVAASIKLKTALNRFDLNTELGKEEQKQFINDSMNKIESYIQFLTHTIDDFRNFFKPDKQKEAVTTLQLVEKTLEIIGKALEVNGISVSISNTATHKISTYANEVTQVILNIFKNAEDAIKERMIKNPTITIVLSEKNNEQIISITDNAGGIQENILPFIFEPYYSTKAERNGTGLGLYMSKIIIEEHCGGKITAQNSSDGARFVIILKENNHDNTHSF